ncbi:MAG: Mur ligase family protein [Bacteroidales bacterium]|nr:Mur ligase family protein [Bacteroidales bacterium]
MGNNNEILKKIIEEPFFNSPVELLNYKVLIGANYFSGDKVILFRIKLNEYDEVFTTQIPGFNEKLKQLIPSLEEHYCSLKQKGGFYIRLNEGTLLGHVMEHIAIELQNLAKMNIGFGKTRETKEKGVYNVVFRFADEYAGIYAGKMAIHIINSILRNEECNISNIIEKLVIIRENRMFGYSTQQIINELNKRDIPFIRLDKYNFVQIGTGCYRKLIRATLTQNAGYLAIEKTDDKYYTQQLLQELSIPVPDSILAKNINDVLNFFHEKQCAIVIKPCKGYRGKKVSVNLKDEHSIIKAYIWTYSYDPEVLVQEYIKGNTYRILVINNKVVAASQLIPPFIIGDGKSTIQELIDKLNNDPLREYGDKGKLTKVEIDEDTLKILELNNYNLSSILPENEKIFLKNTGNMRSGATSIDVTENVHPFNCFIAERIAGVFNLDVAGIDIISEDISKPLYENDARVLEINAAPDFRMHINPTIGESRPVQKYFIDTLFKDDQKYEIPIISITGSKGKTFLTYLLNFAFTKRNIKTGVVNSKGIFINNYYVSKNNCYDSNNVNIILKDPYIEMAIFETPIESILNHGLGYKKAYIGIFLNVYDKSDYYQYDHIRDIDDATYAMSVVVEEVRKDGYAIINADNNYILNSSERIDCKIAYFSTYKNSSILDNLINNGETCCCVDDYRIILYHKKKRFVMCYLDEISKNLYNEQYKLECLLAFCIVGYIFNYDELDIRDLLKEFSLNASELF